jgi:hypothetical protein
MALARASCTVTGTTRSSSEASIITGGTPVPAISPRYSVWPGCLNPAAVSTDFWMGFVTTAPARPDFVSSTASAMAAMTAPALAGSGRPGTGTAGSLRCSTGSAWGKTAVASSDAAIAWIGTPKGRVASSIRKKAGPPARSADQAPAAISAPMPAGSPMVRARGCMMLRV